MTTDTSWFYWALWSAAFAALTAIFAKLGLRVSIPIWRLSFARRPSSSCLPGSCTPTGKWSNPLALAPNTRLFLVLSGLATAASWVCYFRALKVGDASKVAPAPAS
jgi:bacterial/archaeal transporter family protein